MLEFHVNSVRTARTKGFMVRARDKCKLPQNLGSLVVSRKL